MLNKLARIWRLQDLRKSILFVLFMLLVFRIGAHIPIPGVDVEALRQLFRSNQFLGLVNIFSVQAIAIFAVPNIFGNILLKTHRIPYASSKSICRLSTSTLATNTRIRSPRRNTLPLFLPVK